MRISASARRSVSLSALLHGAAILALVWAFQLRPIVVLRPTQAGTAHGTVLSVVYNPGAAPSAAPEPRPAPVPPRKLPPRSLHVPAPPAPAPPPQPTPGVSARGSAGEGSLGDGDISIALVQFHPRPAPDLSSLPPGTAGDVILDAVIDAQGKVAKLTVTRGLGSAIDSTVVATVGQWTFTPATRAGIPTPSEQQILFHYERS